MTDSQPKEIRESKVSGKILQRWDGPVQVVLGSLNEDDRKVTHARIPRLKMTGECWIRGQKRGL